MKRTVGLAIGWVLVLLGIVGLFVPILQGVVLIAAGLLVLSRHSEHAHGWVKRLREQWSWLDRAMDKLHRDHRHKEKRAPEDEDPPGPTG